MRTSMLSSRMCTARLFNPGEVCIQRGLPPEGLHREGSAGGGYAYRNLCRPPPCGQTNTCENITLPQSSFVTIEIPKSNFRIVYQWQIQDFSGGRGGVNLLFCKFFAENCLKKCSPVGCVLSTTVAAGGGGVCMGVSAQGSVYPSMHWARPPPLGQNS